MSDLLAEIGRATRTAAEGPLAAERERPALLPLPRDPTLVGREALVARFRAELEKLTGKVHGPLPVEGVAEKVIDILAAAGAREVIAWGDDELGCPDLAAALRRAGVTLVPAELTDDAGRQTHMDHLATMTAGLTGAHAGLADTGSVVVASGPGRSRVASLLPPVHLAVLPASRIQATMADWLAAGGSDLVRAAANVVVITGPSRTADIELVVSLGVHGPKELHVVLYED